jgi:RimJ/RimL family protein N-acetyltransferase
MIGLVTLDRRGQSRRGHVDPHGGEAELGYKFLQRSWGFGYAAEACVAALDSFAVTLPGEPVVLATEVANQRPSWASLRWSGSRSTTPNSGSAYGGEVVT